jgi:cullin 1
LNVPIKTETEKEKKEVQQNIEDDRKMLIQARIVRIMKTRKTMKYSELIGEVINQLEQHFKPELELIKRCIDMLIEREYLVRNPERSNYYDYVA